MFSSGRGAAECGHSESDGGGCAGAPVDLGEFVLGAGEADLESFGFAEPAFAFGFGDAGDQVVADLGDARPLAGVAMALLLGCWQTLDSAVTR